MYNPSFNVITNSSKRTGVYVQLMNVQQQGWQESFETSFSKTGSEVVNAGTEIVIGDPTKDNTSYFTDDPSSLVVMNRGQFTKIKYGLRHGRVTSTSTVLNSRDCSNVRNKMMEVRGRVGNFNQQINERNQNLQRRVEEMNRGIAQQREEYRKYMEQQSMIQSSNNVYTCTLPPYDGWYSPNLGYGQSTSYVNSSQCPGYCYPLGVGYYTGPLR